ncbi:hypothetical protein [Prescottella equi]|uniref:hypothetical protein n=1 Tax=Rhodococcus hoagii TaxID=43767 RepID=UPI00111C928E|nr:hypothetical protein [Prescottella equi]
MTIDGVWEHTVQPEDLNRFTVKPLNAGDVEGWWRLYEPDAVLALPNGDVAKTTREIHQAYDLSGQRLVHLGSWAAAPRYATTTSRRTLQIGTDCGTSRAEARSTHQKTAESGIFRH